MAVPAIFRAWRGGKELLTPASSGCQIDLIRFESANQDAEGLSWFGFKGWGMSEIRDNELYRDLVPVLDLVANASMRVMNASGRVEPLSREGIELGYAKKSLQEVLERLDTSVVMKELARVKKAGRDLLDENARLRSEKALLLKQLDGLKRVRELANIIQEVAQGVGGNA
jgi:hypothetical protein